MKKMEKNICPFCGEGHLIRDTEDVEYTYKGAKLSITQRVCIATNAMNQFQNLKTWLFNRADLQAFRARIDGLLEPKQIQKLENK